jgi:predicted dithiol-disulfide oxidoreductase (DUF899 family)
MPVHHTVVSSAEWLEARLRLLAKEKEFTRLRDQLSQARRDLPWERVRKNYVFDGPNGPETLAQLFGGCSQLVVYHFMFAPEWNEGCPSCAWWADNFSPNVSHLIHRDVTMIAISRAPLDKLETLKKQKGWTFKWVSSGGNDFNYDYGVSFTPDETDSEIVHNYRRYKSSMTDHAGISVFYRDADGAIYHTYSCYSRGLDMMNAGYHYLDLVPKGRDEDGLPYNQAWVRERDKYGNPGAA